MIYKRNVLIFGILVLIFFVFNTKVYAQKTAHIDFWNIHDTSNCEVKSLIKVPEIIVVNPILLDSIDRYYELSDSLGYDRLDNNGNYFYMHVGYRPDDSSHLHVYIISCETSNLYNDLVISLGLTNTFAPEGYLNYLYGAFVYKGKMIVVCSNQCVQEQELSGLFEIADNEVRIVICDTDYKPNHDRWRPHSQYFALPLLSISNYRCPRWERK